MRGEEMRLMDVSPLEFRLGQRIAVVEGKYFGVMSKVAGVLQKVELENGEVHLTLQVSGTDNEEILKLVGLSSAPFVVHCCPRECGALETGDRYLHGIKGRLLTSEMRVEEWMKNLEAVPKAPRAEEDELADLRMRGEEMAQGPKGERGGPSGVKDTPAEEPPKKKEEEERPKGGEARKRHCEDLGWQACQPGSSEGSVATVRRHWVRSQGEGPKASVEESSEIHQEEEVQVVLEQQQHRGGEVKVRREFGCRGDQRWPLCRDWESEVHQPEVSRSSMRRSPADDEGVSPYRDGRGCGPRVAKTGGDDVLQAGVAEERQCSSMPRTDKPLLQPRLVDSRKSSSCCGRPRTADQSLRGGDLGLTVGHDPKTGDTSAGRSGNSSTVGSAPPGARPDGKTKGKGEKDAKGGKYGDKGPKGKGRGDGDPTKGKGQGDRSQRDSK